MKNSYSTTRNDHHKLIFSRAKLIHRTSKCELKVKEKGATMKQASSDNPYWAAVAVILPRKKQVLKTILNLLILNKR